MSYFILFKLNLQNPVCNLHLQHMSFWTRHILSTQRLLTVVVTILDSADEKSLNLYDNSKKIKASVIEMQRNQVQFTPEQ